MHSVFCFAAYSILLPYFKFCGYSKTFGTFCLSYAVQKENFLYDFQKHIKEKARFTIIFFSAKL